MGTMIFDHEPETRSAKEFKLDCSGLSNDYLQNWMAFEIAEMLAWKSPARRASLIFQIARELERRTFSRFKTATQTPR